MWHGRCTLLHNQIPYTIFFGTLLCLIGVKNTMTYVHYKCITFSKYEKVAAGSRIVSFRPDVKFQAPQCSFESQDAGKEDYP